MVSSVKACDKKFHAIEFTCTSENRYEGDTEPDR
jgi:hypothetical protein